MKGHMEKDGFHPHTELKGVRKARDQSSKHVGIKISRNPKISSKQLEGAPENIKICSTCERSFDINKERPSDFFALPQCADCKRRGVKPL